ncbi:MAG: glycosyltransferase, partial [Lachnospiraceae bacterium]
AGSLYILSSNTEGMPNSLMEAMAMGLPVISTDCPCGGPRMLIQHGVNGLLVPVGEVEAMAAAMAEIMGNEEKARKMGMKALEIREKLNPFSVHEQWESYILSKCR